MQKTTTEQYIMNHGINISILQQKLTSKIRRIRRDKGMSQLDLAISIGVSRSRIANIESGKSSYSLDNLENISKAFQCPVKDLFPDE